MDDLANQEQITAVIHDLAAHYWQQSLDEVRGEYRSIKVIKRTSGKIMGFFPPRDSYPAAFFKIYFYKRGFHNELNGLSAAAALPQSGPVTIPKIIRVFSEYKAILFEKQEWLDTSSVLRRFFADRLDLQWDHLGAWLRRFHDSQTSQEKNAYFLRKKSDKLVLQLEKTAHLFSASQVEKIHQILRTSREYLGCNQVEWVISHGDYGLENIKLSRNGMQVIDFEDSQMAPREFDLVNFLTRLEYLGYFPHLPTDYCLVSREFLDGYGAQLSKTPVSDFLYLLVKLDMLESYSRRKKETSRAAWKLIYHYFERSVMRSMHRWLDKLN